ncbi:related to Alpha-1,2-mannosyltransferase MNN2 [Saccharomycodes ludwigii]|uniref:Related to Alpha-1,2-mannosyltransferase MNN2 n=1 Tax=Saccharomycodes ludwigii TaxID=36035 RepID=A0A376B3R5_9ASCO|nr:related to Alpha-1,2-mannosyltransferase MNN2 [Saccharomycodes ludwigii]
MRFEEGGTPSQSSQFEEYKNSLLNWYKDTTSNDAVVYEELAGNAGSTTIYANKLSDKTHAFFENVIDLVVQYGPHGSTFRKYNSECNFKKDIGYRPEHYHDWDQLSFYNLSNCLKMSGKDKEMLKDAHLEYINALTKLRLPETTYNGGNGIVIVGGGKFSVLALNLIINLRKTGTKILPVEVLIPPKSSSASSHENQDKDFCESLLLHHKEFNAKCIYFDKIFSRDLIEKNKIEFKGYQYKSIAILASSFSNLLLLDADNTPIKSLDHVFDSKIFQDTGLIMWPDFWRRTTSPDYYYIADIEININKRVRNCLDNLTPVEVYSDSTAENKNVPYHDFLNTIPDPSTESGQLMINKLVHLPTILLSFYYNVYGPSWYYPLFSQGRSGEGDKETFIAAAHFYNLPYYQVKTMIDTDGYHKHDGSGYRSVALYQHDFIQDYELYKLAKKDIEKKYGKKGNGAVKFDPNYSFENFYNKYFHNEKVQGGDSGTNTDKKDIDVMFIHCNLPKFDPYELYSNKEFQDLQKDQDDNTFNKNSQLQFRIFEKLDKLNNFDIELEIFDNYNKYLCDPQHLIQFDYLTKKLKYGDQEDGDITTSSTRNGDLEWLKMCKYIKNRLLFLKNTPI